MYVPRTDLVRRADWEPRLVALANEWRAKPYAYGVTDCWQFLLAAVHAQTGAVLMPGIVWPTKLIPVVRIMLANGWESVEDATDDLLPPMPLAESRLGDVVSFEQGGEYHMAVRFAELALTPGLSGLATVDPSTWRRAWKVGGA